MYTKFIDIHTHSMDDCPGVIKLKSYLIGSGLPLPSTPYSAGVHPWSVKPGYELIFPDDDNFVAVGEIGLDYAVKVLDKDLQIKCFESQLKLAVEFNKPVILHCVRAYDDVIESLKRFAPRVVIFHSFIGSIELAQQLVANGYYLSFGVNSLRSYKTMQTLSVLPPERVFLETDDSGVAIEDVYKKAQDVMQCPDLKGIIYNTYNLCKIG